MLKCVHECFANVLRTDSLFGLQKVTGVSFEVEIDWLEFIEPIEGRGYRERLGDIIYDWYVSEVILFWLLWGSLTS